jgi:hypothetical protein
VLLLPLLMRRAAVCHPHVCTQQQHHGLRPGHVAGKGVPRVLFLGSGGPWWVLLQLLAAPEHQCGVLIG